MPASDLLWSASQGHSLHGFGTKRKSCDGGKSLEHDVDMDMEASGDCKRRCMRETVPTEINHNDPELNSYHHSQLQQYPSTPEQTFLTSTQSQSLVNTTHSAAPQSPKHFVSVQQYYGGPQYHHIQPDNAPVDQYPAHTTSETNMVMDLCDETYAAIPDQSRTDIEAAENQMDSDFIPNQQQYTNNSLAFCNPNCVGDQDTSGTRVRCYCKPSWDGLMDVRPYVSDYY